MHVGAGLRFWCAVRKRPHELFRRAAAADGLFKISQAFDKEKRRDVRNVEIIEQHGLVEVQAFERGFVENQYRTLRHRTSLSAGAVRCIVSVRWKLVLTSCLSI